MPNFAKQSNRDDLKNLSSHAISDIYNELYPEIYRYVRYRIGDEVLAEDITSEVFMRYLEAIEKKRGPKDSLQGWLIGIANHVVTDHIRQLYRRPLQELLETLPANSISLPDEVEKREQKVSLHWAIAQLTKDQQHVLALLFGQACSLEETAFLLKKNVNAVKALRFRALAALRRKIEEIAK